jgi:hypothetical protein
VVSRIGGSRLHGCCCSHWRFCDLKYVYIHFISETDPCSILEWKFTNSPGGIGMYRLGYMPIYRRPKSFMMVVQTDMFGQRVCFVLRALFPMAIQLWHCFFFLPFANRSLIRLEHDFRLHSSMSGTVFSSCGRFVRPATIKSLRTSISFCSNDNRSFISALFLDISRVIRRCPVLNSLQTSDSMPGSMMHCICTTT